MPNVREKFDIIKPVKLFSIDNDSGKERYVFKGLDGRIYYVDRKDPGVACGRLKLGDVILVWVIKELTTYGFIRVEVNGMFISEYIASFPNLSADDLFDEDGKRTELLYISNYVKFSDISYEQDIIKNHKHIDTLSNFEGTEQSEQVVGATRALSYLYYKHIEGVGYGK